MAFEIKWTAYKAAAAEALDGANLNSLATGCSAAAGEAGDTIAEIDNSGNLYQYADFFVSLASLNIASATAYVLLSLIPVGNDGSTYPYHAVDHATAANNKVPAHYSVGTIAFAVLNGAQEQVLQRVVLPPTKFRVVITNQLGVSLAASGNTVKLRCYDEQGV